MNTFTRAWQTFFLTPSSSRPLVFFRIAIALLGLAQGIWLAGNTVLLYGEHGLVQWPISEGIVGAHMAAYIYLCAFCHNEKAIAVILQGVDGLFQGAAQEIASAF